MAADPQLGIPPWPVFAGLVVLALAFAGAASLLPRRRLPRRGHAGRRRYTPGLDRKRPDGGVVQRGLVALGALAAFALAAIRMGRAVGDSGTAWSVAAVIALAALHFGAILSAVRPRRLRAVLAAAHAVALGTLLAVATARGWLKLGLLAVGTVPLPCSCSPRCTPAPTQWPARLGLAAAIYAVFLAWPFAAGQRGRRSRASHGSPRSGFGSVLLRRPAGARGRRLQA